MFEEVRKNNLYSNLLIIFFILFISLLGAVIGLIYDNTYFGVGIAMVFSIIYTLIMYSSGSSLVMGLSGAKEVKKQEYPHLFHAVEGLSIAAGIKPPKTYIINDTALNAFATGVKPDQASIAVTTGLLQKLNREELEGVIAHEIAHIKNNDIKFMLLVTVMVGLITLLSDFLLRSFLWGGKGKRDKDGGQIGVILIVVGLVLAILSPFITQLIRLAISRKKEYAADARAVIMTRYPPGLAGALKKIKSDPDPLVDTANKATAHLYISNPFRKSAWWSTHPPIDERIKRIEGM